METTFCVYVLRSAKDRKLYIGMTDNVERRLKEHNQGKSVSTRHRRPLSVVHQEKYSNRMDARKRERYLKSGPGHTYLKTVLQVSEVSAPTSSG